MKKLHLITLFLLLALVLVACGGDDNDDGGDNGNDGDRQDTQSEDSGNDDNADAESSSDEDSDDNAGSSGGGNVTDSGERAMLALFSGDGESFAAEFCDEVQTDLNTFASALQGGPGDGVEQKASCSEDGADSIRCDYSVIVSGIETPSGSYSIAIQDGQLCGIPETAN